jgi:DNA-directed RNA polymerase sigma subunit (sigma70/sigma32)
MSNYCFFNYTKDYLTDIPSDKEIAHMNNVSVETIKKIEAKAMEKIKQLSIIRDLDGER